MSRLTASIKKIERVDNLHLVTFQCYGKSLKMVSLELGERMQVGTHVVLGCKPTAVAVAKVKEGESLGQQLSYTNQIAVKIEQIRQGELLSNLVLSFGAALLESIVTAESVDRLQLQEGEHVTALIKVSELSIVEVLDD
jgi:molybdopterin-binding protein